MRDKVKSEVTDLRQIQRTIMRDEAKIKQLNELRERNAQFQNVISGQTKFNKQLAHDYKQKIKDLNDGIAGADVDVRTLKYELDPGCL